MILPSLFSLHSRVCFNLASWSVRLSQVLIGWKRVLLADAPRQTINALTLYAIYDAHRTEGNWYEFSIYFKGNSLSTTALTISTLFTVIVFAGSLLLLIVAGLCYIPLLCHIRGNLKVSICYDTASVLVYDVLC